MGSLSVDRGGTTRVRSLIWGCTSEPCASAWRHRRTRSCASAVGTKFASTSLPLRRKCSSMSRTPENVSRSPEEATQAEKIAMTAPVVTRPSSGDSKGQKIAMTAPVVTTKSDDQSDGGGYWMQFIMPSKWTLETLPTPTDPNVKLKP